MPVALCADDDDEILAIYRAVLASRYDVRTCSNGVDALREFEAAGADVVILDVDMPELTGLEVCRALRQRPNGFDVPIVIVSANDSEDDIVTGLSLGADDYIVKPVNPTELLAKVSMVFKRRQQAISKDLGLSLGSRFAGRYEIIDKIGSGGYGSVYHAHDLSDDAAVQVAIKIYDTAPSQRDDEEFISLFLREAYLHSKLAHENIAHLFDFGQAGASHYIVMEYVDGMSLADRVQLEGALPQELVIDIADGMVRALQYMDTQNMVHRDIKPGNILIAGNGMPKLTDFGLARLQDDRTLSAHNEFKGTPQFVSPEQISGVSDIDIRCDLYSLGATLYYAATAAMPFTGNSTLAVLQNHFRETPAPAHEVNSGLTPAFSELIAEMMVTDREQRAAIGDVIYQLSRLS
jgi:DNA-binding response OmpR family regulator